MGESLEHRAFAIHTLEEERLIGIACATHISRHSRHAKVGITVGDRDYLHRDGRHWDRGLYALLETEYRDRRAETNQEASPEAA